MAAKAEGPILRWSLSFRLGRLHARRDRLRDLRRLLALNLARQAPVWIIGSCPRAPRSHRSCSTIAMRWPICAVPMASTAWKCSVRRPTDVSTPAAAIST